MERTRSRTWPPPERGSTRIDAIYSNGQISPPVLGQQPGTLRSSSMTMTDHVGDNHRNGKRPIKPCTWSKSKSSGSFSLDAKYELKTSSPNWGRDNRLRYMQARDMKMTSSYGHPSMPLRPQYPEPDINTLWDKIDGNFKPHEGLFVTALELIEGGVIRKFPEVIRSLKRLIPRKGFSGQAKTGISWRQLIQGDLAYKFQLKPTVLELADFLSGSLAVQDRFERLKEWDQTYRTIYSNMAETVTEVTPNGSVYSYNPYLAFSTNSRCDVVPDSPAIISLRSRYFVRVKPIYDLTRIAQLHLRMGYWGLSHPLSTLWALAPLSFVVDWFVNIRQYAEYLDRKIGLDPRPLVRIASLSPLWRTDTATTLSGGRMRATFSGDAANFDVNYTKSAEASGAAYYGVQNGQRYIVGPLPERSVPTNLSGLGLNAGKRFTLAELIFMRFSR